MKRMSRLGIYLFLTLSSTIVGAAWGQDLNTPYSSEKLLLTPLWLENSELSLGLEYNNPEIHAAMEDISLKGPTVTFSHQFPLQHFFSTSSKFAYSYQFGNERRFMGNLANHDLSTKVLRYYQTLEYDINYSSELTIIPFVDLSLGLGWIKSKVRTREEGFVSRQIAGDAPLGEIGAGGKMSLQNGLTPFVRLSYRWWKIDRLETETSEQKIVTHLSGAEKWNFNGSNWLMGLGYSF